MSLESRLILLVSAIGADYKTLLKREHVMESATGAVALKITQPNTVDPDTSTEIIQIFYKAVKGMWTNEGGNLRSESYAHDQVPLKLFGRRGAGTQTANLLEIYTGGGASELITAVLPNGFLAGPGQIRAVQSTPPNTSSWKVDQIWLDTSTEV